MSEQHASWLLDYNAFHLQRISDAINRKQTTQRSPDSHDSMNIGYTVKDRLYWIHGSFSELQWCEGEFGDGSVFIRQTFFKSQIRTIRDAKVWFKRAKEELEENGLLPVSCVERNGDNRK